MMGLLLKTGITEKRSNQHWGSFAKSGSKPNHVFYDLRKMIPRSHKLEDYLFMNYIEFGIYQNRKDPDT